MSKKFAVVRYPCRERSRFLNGSASLDAKPIRWVGPKRFAEDVGHRTAGDAPTVSWSMTRLTLGGVKIDPGSAVYDDCHRWLKGAHQAEIDRFFYEDYL